MVPRVKAVGFLGTVASLEVLAMGGMAEGDEPRESMVVVVVERQEGVFKLEFGCDISVLRVLRPIKEGIATL